MKLSNSAQDGSSIIEFIIAISLSAVVLIGAVRFTKNFGDVQARNNARDMSRKTNNLLIDILKNDFVYETALDVSKKPFRLTLSRREVFKKDSMDQVYTVTYETKCSPINGSHKEKTDLLKKAFSQNSEETYAKTHSRCLAELSCPSMTIPTVMIRSTSILRLKESIEFPVSNSSESVLTSRQSIGTALCYKVINNQIQVSVESLYLSDNKSGAMSVVSDEVLLLPNGMSNISLLPSH
ncbi:MAG: hypothetical protein EOP04_01195 [Proteobacteria bacterium]|nr:MAG: hypothetical protein EOP04_01195 [Pseudomonadota bacterium]